MCQVSDYGIMLDYYLIFDPSFQVSLYLVGKTLQWIEEQKDPYDTTRNQWVRYDNTNSINVKVLISLLLRIVLETN